MLNILLETPDLTLPFLRKIMKKRLKPRYTVAVIAFSFLDDMCHDLDEWNALYNKDHGEYYHDIVDGLMSYGIPEENIRFVNYFTDTKESAAEIVKAADVLYFTGGLPDRMMDRIREFELTSLLMEPRPIVMGFSAGAVIQLKEYHVAPDMDYPAFMYAEGLPYLDDFYVAVHYDGTEEQDEAIQKVLCERKKTVYAPAHDKGAILVENGIVKLLGNVKIFRP